MDVYKKEMGATPSPSPTIFLLNQLSRGILPGYLEDLASYLGSFCQLTEFYKPRAKISLQLLQRVTSSQSATHLSAQPLG